MFWSRMIRCCAALLVAASMLPVAHAQNQNQNPTANRVMGQVDFKGVTKLDRESGVWVDNQYVGYVKEQKVVIEPGKTILVTVRLEKDPNAVYAKVNAQVKIDVTPDRAAVFVDGKFAGSVSDFKGVGKAMLIAPGKHKIKIDLAGYRPFETDVDLLPNQKMTVKTDLIEGSILQADPAIKNN